MGKTSWNSLFVQYVIWAELQSTVKQENSFFLVESYGQEE